MNTNNIELTNWRKIVRKYAIASPKKSWWQIVSSLIPYIILWFLMIKSLAYSVWLTLALAFISSFFLVRIFIIFHDCGHGSFFKSKTMNTIVGVLIGFLSFTPFHKWTYEHAVHHKTVGNLDKRGIGDILTLTVEEFKNSSTLKKIGYRLVRNSFFLFFVGSFFNFLIIGKFPNKNVPKKINLYSILTLLIIIVIYTVVSYFWGIKIFFLIQVPVLYFASIWGIYLFYVQHQYEDVIWEISKDWNYTIVAMEGSSYLKLPKILQYFSGNIGFHHIHHLSPKIPNYNLEKCMNENVIFQKKPLTFFQTLKQMNLNLWDESKRKLITFKQAMS